MSYDSIFRPDLLNGQTIIIAGSDSGIGHCTAHELTALGARVVLVGRKAEKLEKATDEIVEDGDSVSWHVCDIREREAVKALVANILAEHGTIHHLIDNVDGQCPPLLASISQRGSETVFRTNLVGDFLVAREVFSQLMSKTGNNIVSMFVNIWGGIPDMGHSGATRSGMESFTRTAAVKWGHAGMRVNAVAPDWIASGGMDTYEGAFRAVIPTLCEHVPLKRIGSESEVAAAIVFLLSPGVTFVSGNMIHINGAASRDGRAFPLLKSKPEQSRAYNGLHHAYLSDVLKDQED